MLGSIDQSLIKLSWRGCLRDEQVRGLARQLAINFPIQFPDPSYAHRAPLVPMSPIYPVFTLSDPTLHNVSQKRLTSDRRNSIPPQFP